MDHVTVIPGEGFRKILLHLADFSDAPRNVKSYASSSANQPLITSDVEWCHGHLPKSGVAPCERLSRLLQRSELVLPTYVPPARNAELEARVQLLKAQQANREYKAMTRNVDQSTAAAKVSFDSIGGEMKEVNRQIVAGMQYLLSIVGTFFAILIVSGFALTEMGYRILLSVVCAIAVGVAEIYFVIREDMCQEEYIAAKKRQ